MHDYHYGFERVFLSLNDSEDDDDDNDGDDVDEGIGVVGSKRITILNFELTPVHVGTEPRKKLIPTTINAGMRKLDLRRGNRSPISCINISMGTSYK